MIHPRSRKAFILLSVLLLVAVAVVAATTMLATAGTARLGAEVSRSRDQARSLAWSGVQVVMAELAEQRERLLQGELPELTTMVTVFETSTGERGVVRLMDWGNGEVAASENARLDLNSATAEMLAELPDVGMALADKIVAARGSGKFQSVAELLRVEGVTSALLYGDLDQPGLGRLLTVYSFDPNVQSGIDDDAYSGQRRLNFNVDWSDALSRAIADRWDANASQTVEGLFSSGASFESDADVVGAMTRLGLEADGWGAVLDVLTTSPDPYQLGRVDLMRAPAEVLAALPGIDASAAARIVDARERLPDDQRRSVAWPAAEEILTTDQFLLVVDRLTARSMQWRVRVEAGLIDAAEQGLSAAEERNAMLGSDQPMRSRVVLEAVIDVSSSRPRIAFLRDVSVLELALQMASKPDTELDELEFEPESEPAEMPAEESLFARSFFAEPEAEEPREPSVGSSSPRDIEDGKDRRIGRWRTVGGGS